MRYHVFAIDYDGTLAEHETVSGQTVQVLRQVKESGRKLILVTGRELTDLKRVFAEYQLFDYIVAENGALIYNTATGDERLLGHPPSDSFVRELKRRGVHPLSVGKVIVATWEPHEKAVLEVIKQSGLELPVIFNKGAVMILPPGINKATGLSTLLASLHLSARNTVAIGDAENDSAMLEMAEYAVAVKNALPALKEKADFVTTADSSAGVGELLLKIIKDEHIEVTSNISRHYLHLGTLENQQNFTIKPYGPGILLGGVSQAGKSTFAAAITENLISAGYQVCLIDPEGDYTQLSGMVTIGNDVTLPAPEEIAELLKDPRQNLIVCMLSVPLADRSAFFGKLWARLFELRRLYGHPHWIILDEAHHLTPSYAPIESTVPVGELNSFMLISTSPHALSQALLSRVGMVITVGDNEKYILEQFCQIMHCAVPENIPGLSAGEACIWETDNQNPPYKIRYKMPQQLQHRHKRKYAFGDMAYNSFVFTGRHNKLKLKANNLMMFVQLAEGIDDDTWLYHLQRNDYKNWVDGCIHDKSLARIMEQAAKYDPVAQTSKRIILDYIKEKYTVV